MKCKEPYKNAFFDAELMRFERKCFCVKVFFERELLLAEICQREFLGRCVPNNLGGGEVSENNLTIYKPSNFKLCLRLHFAFLKYGRNL